MNPYKFYRPGTGPRPGPDMTTYRKCCLGYSPGSGPLRWPVSGYGGEKRKGGMAPWGGLFLP